MSTRRTTPEERDSRTGRFISLAAARRPKATATLDRMPIGHGCRQRAR